MTRRFSSGGALIGGYGILPYPRCHQTIFPQNPQNPQKLLAENILPQIARMRTDILGHPPSLCYCRRVCSVGSTSLLGWCSRDCCTPWGNICEFRAFRGRTLRTLTFRACVPWEDTHCLYTRPSSTSEINDYGYALGWRLQPKPIVLARHPSSRRGRPASHP